MSRGFTLLEAMLAMAILSGSLTWIVLGMSRNVEAQNHAKLISVATFLARAKMIQIEDELYEKGFSDFEKELKGDFKEEGFPRFTWQVVIDKIELPKPDQMQTVLGRANEIKEKITGKPAPTTGQQPASNNQVTAGIGALGAQFGTIKDVLEQAIRRAELTVLWSEKSRAQSLTVVAYFTDPRKVDQATQSLLPALSGAAGGAGTSGTSGTGTSAGGIR